MALCHIRGDLGRCLHRVYVVRVFGKGGVKIPPFRKRARVVSSEEVPPEITAILREIMLGASKDDLEIVESDESPPPCIEKIAQLEARIRAIERRLNMR